MKIVSVETMRSLERMAVESGVPEFRLMERAGRNAAALLDNFCRSRFRRVVFFCGGGNNGGDAIVCAAALRTPHVLIPLKDLDTLKGAAAEAFRKYREKLNILPLDGWDPEPGDLAADALLGIGFKGGEIRASLHSVLEKMSRIPVAAFDLPSGLDGDTGIMAQGGVKAELTLTFGIPKQGLFLKDGPGCSGKIIPVPIGVENFPAEPALDFSCFSEYDAKALLPRNENSAHKNTRGRVLLLCGSCAYPGAAALAAQGALHFSGITRLISVKTSAMPPLPAALIPLMLSPDETGSLPPDALKIHSAALEASDILCAGCGWGSVVSPELLQSVLQFPGKLVLDADALNLLSRHPELWNRRSDAVLTPHPGEALRLAQGFGIPAGGSREEFALRLARGLNTCVVLKGFHTCTATPDGEVTVNCSGGPELAMAGSGDVLAGIISGLGARLSRLADGARLGVFLHGKAGDTGRGTVIADQLPRLAAEAAAELQTWW